MLSPIYLLSAIVLSAAATPSGTEQHFVAFKAEHGFEWSTPMQTSLATGECGEGQTMAVHDIEGVGQSKGYRLSVMFCHDGNPTTDETQNVLGEALTDLRTLGAQAIADPAQRTQIINLLQGNNSSPR